MLVIFMIFFRLVKRSYKSVTLPIHTQVLKGVMEKIYVVEEWKELLSSNCYNIYNTCKDIILSTPCRGILWWHHILIGYLATMVCNMKCILNVSNMWTITTGYVAVTP